MRPRHPATSALYPRIRLIFTDHPITVRVEVILLRLYVELIRLRAALVPLLASLAKTSNNQIPAVEVPLVVWVALGAERFELFTRNRRDPLIPHLQGLH